MSFTLEFLAHSHVAKTVGVVCVWDGMLLTVSFPGIGWDPSVAR